MKMPDPIRTPGMKRFIVQVKDCVWGTRVYPELGWSERFSYNQSRGAPIRRQTGWTIEGSPIYETESAAIPDKFTLNERQVIYLLQSVLNRDNVDRVVIRAV